MNSKNRQGYAVGMNTSHRISGKHNKGSFLTESTVSPGKVPRLCLPCDSSAIRPLSACLHDRQDREKDKSISWAQSDSNHFHSQLICHN